MEDIKNDEVRKLSYVLYTKLKEYFQGSSEGIKTSNNGESFTFDFSTDDTNDIISLIRNQPYKLEAYGDTYYYSYEFSSSTDSPIRAKFIKYIKDNFHINDEEVSRFITSALNNLNKEINLASYTAIVYPESLSDLNRRCLRYIRSLSDGKIISFDVVETLSQSTEEENKHLSKLKGNVLVLDDIVTSGATISNILKAIRVINPNNSIVVFSLIGTNKLK